MLGLYSSSGYIERSSHVRHEVRFPFCRNLPVLVSRLILTPAMLFTIDMVELYSPPAINYGFVYPPAILIFITSLIYSVLSPVILIFAAIYFGVTCESRKSYSMLSELSKDSMEESLLTRLPQHTLIIFILTSVLVYKYKLLYVYVNRYESTGLSWPTTFSRLIWGIVFFQLFMTGTFAVRKSVVAGLGMVPLLGVTVVWSWWMRGDLEGLSRHTALSAITMAEETVSCLCLDLYHIELYSICAKIHRADETCFPTDSYSCLPMRDRSH